MRSNKIRVYRSRYGSHLWFVSDQYGVLASWTTWRGAMTYANRVASRKPHFMRVGRFT